MVTAQRAGVHAQGVVHQGADIDRLQQGRRTRIGLLGRDDVLDVVHAFAQLRQLIAHALLFGGNRFDQLVQIARQQLALFILGKEGAQVALVSVDQLHGLAQAECLAAAQLAADQVGRDVHTVEHVTDVVQHVGGDLRHAGLAGAVHQLALGILELLRAPLHPLLQGFVGGLQRAVDAVDLGEAAQQAHRQIKQ